MNLSNLSIKTRLIGAFGVIVAILIGLVAMAKNSQDNQARTQDMNVHTYQVLGKADSILAALINMETGARGYMLTGVDSFQEPLLKGRESFDSEWRAIKELTSDNPAQQRRLDDLKV